jgi:hypothetical protein
LVVKHAANPCASRPGQPENLLPDALHGFELTFFQQDNNSFDFLIDGTTPEARFETVVFMIINPT